jgi:AcrR family transcriptional regulator
MPKIVNHEAYRLELLEKCMDLIVGKGYSNITMREIAEEIGVSTGTLYHYFPTKQSILEKMFVHVKETNIRQYLDRIENARNIAEKIDAISKFLLENEDYYKNILLLAVDLYRHHQSEATDKIFNEFSEAYCNVLSKELKMADQVAQAFFIYLLGLVFHRILTPGQISYQQQVDMIRDLMANYMSEHGAAV